VALPVDDDVFERTPDEHAAATNATATTALVNLRIPPRSCPCSLVNGEAQVYG
jgi:hypothetical protein